MRLMPFSDDLGSPTIGAKQPFSQDSNVLRIDDQPASKGQRRDSMSDHFGASLHSMPLEQVEMLSRIEALVRANIDLLSMIEWRALSSEDSTDALDGQPDFVHRFQSNDPSPRSSALRLL